MAFDVSALAEHIGDDKFALIAKVQLTGGLAEAVSIQANVKHKENLQIFSTDITFGDDSCDRTPTGSTVFSQREMVVGAIKISENWCMKDLTKQWTSLYLKQGANNENDLGELEGIILDSKLNKIKNALAKADFQGDLTSADPNLNKYDGLIKVLSTEPTINVSNGGVVVTPANILSVLDTVYLALTDEISDKEDLSLWMPKAYYKMYMVALKNANLYHYTAESNDVKLYGTNVTLRQTVGLSGLTEMYLASDSNIVIGVDGENDEEEINVRVDPTTNVKILFDVAFKRGIQVGFPDEIVKFTEA